MTGDLVIEPNLWGLLTELAEHPERARLLARPVPFRDLLRADSLQLIPSSGLSVGEKHLLQAHRDEVAHLLLQASQLVLRSGNRVFLQPRDEAGAPALVDAERWRSRAEWLTTLRYRDSEHRGGLALLAQALHLAIDDTFLSRELALASVRLRPSPTSRVLLAHRTYYGGDRERGLELGHKLLSDGVSGLVAAYAWSNLSAALLEQGRFCSAIEAARSAIAVRPTGRGCLNWMCAALQLGVADELHQAAARAKDHLAEGELEEFAFLIESDRKLGIWKPTTAAQACRLRFGDQASPCLERLLEAFL